jgi:hypothetical protein
VSDTVLYNTDKMKQLTRLSRLRISIRQHYTIMASSELIVDPQYPNMLSIISKGTYISLYQRCTGILDFLTWVATDADLVTPTEHIASSTSAEMFGEHSKARRDAGGQEGNDIGPTVFTTS